MDFVAIKAEAILEDEENLSALTFWWGKKGSYFAISTELGSAQIHCELGDQSNGFYAKTISYELAGRQVVFRLSKGETFDEAHIFIENGQLLQEVRLDTEEANIPAKMIQDCLTSIFS